MFESNKMMRQYSRVPFSRSSTAMDSSKQHQILSGVCPIRRDKNITGRSDFWMLLACKRSMVALAPILAMKTLDTSGHQLPDKAPSEGCGVLIQDQQHPGA